MPKYKLGFARFPFGQTDHPDVTDWLVDTVIKAKADPHISDVVSWRIDDTPITMGRNRCLLNALQSGVDFLIMVDNDMAPDVELLQGDPTAKPFWDSTWAFMWHRAEPCVVASPYCGPPPLSNLYVFHWASWQNWDQNPQPDHRLEQYSRNEAAQLAGIHPAGALPTGLIMIDMRAIAPLGLKNTLRLKPPWFYYEWKDEYESQKASTEDVTFSRDLGLLGVELFCNWDAWSGHWKRLCVRKPQQIFADQVSDKLKEAARNGINSDERLLNLSHNGLTSCRTMPVLS